MAAVVPDVKASLGENAEISRVLQPLEHFRKCIRKNMRIDGRPFLSSRELKAGFNEVSTAHGSATENIGKTCVVAGIKLELSDPDINEPTHGRVDIDVQLRPLCSQRHGFSAYSEEALAMGEFSRKTILSSGAVDLADLCIEEGKTAWAIKVDAICLDDDGSVTDCVILAIICALRGLQLPALERLEATNELRMVNVSDDLSEKEIKYPAKALPLYGIPVPMSFGLFDGAVLLADPTSEEEKLIPTTFVTVGMLNAEVDKISLYKQGGGTVSLRVLKDAFEILKRRIRLLGALLANSDPS